MAGCHQIDIGRSFFLKFQEDFRETLQRYDISVISQSDIPVLAENTLQTAAGEEDSAGTAASAYAGFLPKVQSCPGGSDLSTLSAEASSA